MRVGLIGLGLMGRGMGLSLMRAGHRLSIVAHRRRETADALCAAGAGEAAGPAELARDCDAVVCCLPSVEAARQVLLGPAGIASAGRRGLLVIECSTLLPDAAVEFEQGLAAAGVAFVDAPLTRGPDEALAGTLNALVGGSPEAVEQAAPVLAAFCERQFGFGPAGRGYAAKLISNFLAFSNLVAVAEAMATAFRAGLDPSTLLQAISVSGGQSRVLESYGPFIAGTGAARSRVTVATAHKDVDYYRRFAAALGTAGPAADGVVERFAQAVGAGLGERLTPEFLEHVAKTLGSRAG